MSRPEREAGAPILLRHVFAGLAAGNRGEAFGELARRLAEAGAVKDAADVVRRLEERERLGSTSLGGGIAIPHLKMSGSAEPAVAVASFPEGVDFGAPDGLPVRLIFLVISPADSPAAHLQILARISRLLRARGVADNLLRASSPEEIRAALEEAQAPTGGVRT